MRKNVLVILFGLFLVFPVCAATADDMYSDVLFAPPGEMLARAYTPTLPGQGGTQALLAGAVLMEDSEAEAGVQMQEKLEGEEAYDFNVQFGKDWLFKAFSYKKFPTVWDFSELSGYQAKADAYRCGTVETRWNSVNTGIETVANFFAGSPLLWDSDYFVRQSILFDEALPAPQ
jgi:hypothetical protein